MPTTGKMYFGSTLIAEPGMQWEYDRPYPPDYGTYSTWTIPGTLQQTFTTSGTYTPAAGVSTVHVAVISGGSPGDANNGNSGGNGGAGGNVAIYRNVPVSGDVTVTIGGQSTTSSFGSLTALGKASLLPGFTYRNQAAVLAQGVGQGGLGSSYNSSGYPAAAVGVAGVLINGTRYVGGGGGGTYAATYPPGGAGGGGHGGAAFKGNATSGTNGYGGGGGGAPGGSPGLGAGGSGRVMIWSEDV